MLLTEIWIITEVGGTVDVSFNGRFVVSVDNRTWFWGTRFVFGNAKPSPLIFRSLN